MGPAGPAHPEQWADREIWSETFDVPREKIASTCGAGDASIAGFLAGLISGASLETACELACAVAGLKIQVKTSVGGILPLDEVLAPHSRLGKRASRTRRVWGIMTLMRASGLGRSGNRGLPVLLAAPMLRGCQAKK